MAEEEWESSTLHNSVEWQTRARLLKLEPNLVTCRVDSALCHPPIDGRGEGVEGGGVHCFIKRQSKLIAV
jgi:hypothetical protein